MPEGHLGPDSSPPLSWGNGPGSSWSSVPVPPSLSSSVGPGKLGVRPARGTVSHDAGAPRGQSPGFRDRKTAGWGRGLGG